MTGMRTTGTMVAGVSLLLAATACSSGAAKVLVQSTPTPGLSVSAPPSAPPTTPAATAKHHSTRTQVVAARSAPAGATTASSKPAATHAPATATPKPASTPTQTKAAGCTTTGPTTTIQMVTGDHFQPSAVTINRCDAVKAVYADTTGIPHNWQGHGWTSPDMTSTGQSYTYRFTSTGTFNFFCSYHQGVGMTGTVTVH